MATNVGPKTGEVGIVGGLNIFDPVLESGQLANPVAGVGDADHVLGLPVEHVALAENTEIQGQMQPRAMSSPKTQLTGNFR